MSYGKDKNARLLLQFLNDAAHVFPVLLYYPWATGITLSSCRFSYPNAPNPFFLVYTSASHVTVIKQKKILRSREKIGLLKKGRQLLGKMTKLCIFARRKNNTQEVFNSV